MTNPQDTTKKQSSKSDDRIRILQFTYSDTLRKALDTSISILHRNPLMTIWDVDLGNFASSGNSLFFNPSMEAQPTSGFERPQKFIRRAKDLVYYNTTRPYTNLYYRLGTKQEQMIEIMQSQNIKPNWNVTATYAKIGSPGMYKLQKTNHDRLQLSTNYQSKNNRYNLLGGITYNKIQQDENGGILFDSLLLDLRYNDKRLMPIRFDALDRNTSTVKNYFRQANFMVEQSYFFGKTSTIFNQDSSEKTINFKPIFGIKHQAYATFEYQRLKDLSPEIADYNQLNIPFFLERDSVISRYYTTQIGNEFSLQGNLRWKERIFQAEAGYGLEIESPQTKNLNALYFNNFLMANIKKESIGDREWLYGANTKFYFSGNAIGNLQFKAHAGRAFSNRLGNLQFSVEQSIQQAPYSLRYYKTGYYELSKTFNKQTISKISGEYINSFYHFKAGISNFVLTNYIYRDSNLKANQFKEAIPLLQIYIDKQFRYKQLVMDQHYIFQQVSDNSPIHLPRLGIRYRLAYERYIFNHKLQIATGIDARYNTAYFADNYSPIFNSFIPQYTDRIANVPQVGLFFNFKVKRYRAFISLDELQQSLTANNMNFPHYPAQNMMLRFGFHWAFIN